MSEDESEFLSRLREIHKLDRVKRREDMYNKQRRLIAEQCHTLINKEYKEADVINAAKAISKSSTKKKEKPFTTLKNSFIQNPCHMVSFMKVDGAMHALAGHLISNKSIEQLLALECCCNLSLGDTKTCLKLAKAIAPYLFTILQGLNYNLMNVALLTINNLCGSGQEACQLLHTQGILKVLEKTLLKPELRDNTTKALVMFTKNGSSNLTEADVKHLVCFLLPHFEHSDQVQWLVYLLSSHVFITPILIQQDMPMRVMKLLSSLNRLRFQNIISVTALVRTLGNLSADPDGITAMLMLNKWDMTTLIIKFFLATKYRHLCKEVYWCLGNILQHKNAEVQKKLAIKGLDLSWIGSRGAPSSSSQPQPPLNDPTI